MNEETQTEFLKVGGVKHVRWDELPKETLNPLFDRQLVVGDQVMVARVLLKKGALYLCTSTTMNKSRTSNRVLCISP
jgi:hypothetical protein